MKNEKSEKNLKIIGLLEGSGIFFALIFLSLIVTGILITRTRKFDWEKYTKEQVKRKPQAVLWLTKGKQPAVVNNTIETIINLDTRETEVSAATIVLTYDHKQLKLIKVVDGAGFDNYLVDQSEPGTLYLEAISSPGNSFFGEGKIGKIEFEALKTGETEVTLNFSKSKEDGTDSGVISAETGRDILNEVTNCTYKIINQNT